MNFNFYIKSIKVKFTKNKLQLTDKMIRENFFVFTR